MIRVHGTAVAIAGRGVLIRGAPGAGKSDLALRLIAAGARLIADDQVELAAESGVLLASPPATIAGLIEIRGVGIRRVPHLSNVPLALVADIAASVERLPEPLHVAIEGVTLARIEIAPFEASATAKLCVALDSEAAIGAVHAIGYTDGAMRTSGRSRSISTGEPSKPRILLITGMSGAGRSSALKLLEDMGYEAVDNLPLSLLPGLAGNCDFKPHPIAVGIDIRTRDFAVENVFGEIEKIAQDGALDVKLVFLDCADEGLERRYTETRRRHPMAGDRPVLDGIRLERARVAPLRQRADLVIDTTGLRTAGLKRLLAGNFGLDEQPGLRLFVTSFSFREGLPREADLVFDVRFLENPFYDPELRHSSGRDPAVARFIAADPGWAPFFAALTQLLQTLLPRYDNEGKSYLTIAFGCTGGRHRSVFAAECLRDWLKTNGHSASVAHRDIERAAEPNIPDASSASRVDAAVA